MRSYVAAVAFLLAGCSSLTVKGIVRDKVTASPIAGAQVSIEGAETAVTGENGLYTIVLTPGSGPRAVSVSAPEHYPWSDLRVFSKQASPLLLNVDLITEDDVIRKRQLLDARGRSGAPNVTVTTVPTVTTPSTVTAPSSSQPAAETPRITHCTACGSALDPSAHFCGACGSRVH